MTKTKKPAKAKAKKPNNKMLAALKRADEKAFSKAAEVIKSKRLANWYERQAENLKSDYQKQVEKLKSDQSNFRTSVANGVAVFQHAAFHNLVMLDAFIQAFDQNTPKLLMDITLNTLRAKLDTLREQAREFNARLGAEHNLYPTPALMDDAGFNFALIPKS